MLHCSQQCHVILVRLFSYIGNAPASIVWRKMLNILRPTETPGSLFCRHYQIYYLHWQRLYRDSNFTEAWCQRSNQQFFNTDLANGLFPQLVTSHYLKQWWPKTQVHLCICACPWFHLSIPVTGYDEILRLILQLIKRCMDCVPYIFSNITVAWHAAQLPPNQKPSQIAMFMGPSRAPPGSCRPQMGPMLVPWTLLSGMLTSSQCKRLWQGRWYVRATRDSRISVEWSAVVRDS